MFDFSFPEMVVVFVVGLLVLGPERLPRVARTVGLWVGKARGMFAQVRSELEREANFQELQAVQRELRQSLEEGNRIISEQVKSVAEAVDAQSETSAARPTAPDNDRNDEPAAR